MGKFNKEIIKREIKWPINRWIYESDGGENDLCSECGSSLRRKFNLIWGIRFWKTTKCIQPECDNYYDKQI